MSEAKSWEEAPEIQAIEDRVNTASTIYSPHFYFCVFHAADAAEYKARVLSFVEEAEADLAKLKALAEAIPE